jgi:DNA recombination protein RmuC
MVLALLLLLVLALAVGLVWLGRSLRAGQVAFGDALSGLGEHTAAALIALRDDTTRQLAERNADVDRRLAGVIGTLDRRLGQLDGKVDRRLEAAQKTTAEIHERLGKVDSAAAQMIASARDLSKLEQALKPPKARGGFGELLLENLLRDRLPRAAYEMQYGFSTGERVDAVARAGELLIPVDSKFPLDNYQRIVDSDSDEARQLAERAFARDVKAHVDAIATKYVRPDEGTSDFAFMYIPVEAVYYEIACGRTSSVLEYAHERRVFPVSPSTFTAYLQVIAFGLRGMQIEQRAQEVMAYVADLSRDFERFEKDFEVVGTHLGNAQSKYAAAEKRLDRFAGKLEHAAEAVEPDELEGEAAEEDEPPFVIEAA